MVADGLEEGFTGFQLFKSAAPNSSMAPSYEHSSVYKFAKIAGSVKIPILFHFFVLARASRKNKAEARKPSMISPFKPDTYRFEHRGS